MPQTRFAATPTALMMLTALSLLTPATAHAQDSYEETRRLYTTTTIGLLVGLPVTIINNAAGNPADDSALAALSVSTNLSELSQLSSSTAAANIEAARQFSVANQLSLASDIAMGNGEVLQELIVVLGLPVGVLEVKDKRQRLMRAQHHLNKELGKLAGGADNTFLEALFEVLYLSPKALTPSTRSAGSAASARG